MASLPKTIRAAVTQQDRTVKAQDIPFKAATEGVPEGHILVKVKAAGINPTDWKHAYVEALHNPNRVTGCDASGDVVAVGSGITHFRVGDRVAGVTHGSKSESNGSFAEYVLFKSHAAFKLPEGMRYEEGAAWPVPDFTYLQAAACCQGLPLPSPSNPKRDESVFIWGGATSIGWHAIQLAKLLGLKVLTVASSKHHATLREIGADEVLDYKDADVLDRLKKIVREWGNVKYGFDCISENGTTENCVDILAETPGGAHLVTVLPSSPETKERNANVKVELTLGYTFFGEAFTFAKSFSFDPKPDHVRVLGDYFQKPEHLPAILDGWKSGQGSKYFRAQKLVELEGGVDKIDEAMRMLQDGKTSGEKIVVKF
ncbi:Zinc-binding oxidoreductase alcohol dehydrogenase [Tilletia horrida]|nr:Zinc-binding oxidoreductase alcohol dehydrogenase [Tilletia horrida]